MKRTSWCMLALVTLGCGSVEKTDPGEASDSSTSNSLGNLRKRSSTDPVAVTPQPKLGDGEIRVALVVRPGDALVEVDKLPVRRRNGLVELTGNVGKEFQVEVFWGGKPTVEVVKIESAGTSPAFIDATRKNVEKSTTPAKPVVVDNNE